MIKVQAFRESESPSHEAPEEYGKAGEEKDEKEKKRRAPIVFLLFLGAIALYLKSFLPTSSSEATPGSEDSKPEPETAELPPRDAPLTLAENHDHEEDGSQEGVHQHEEHEEDADAEPGNVLVFTSSYIPGFLTNDSPALEFSSAGRIAPSTALGRPGSGTPQNDNFLTTGRGAGSSGGSGAGVSGGGGSGGSGGGGTDGTGNNDNNTGDNDGNGNNGNGNENPGDGDPPANTNRPPRLSGAVRLHEMVGFHAYFISLSALLRGATDEDGDTLSVVALTASRGTLTPTEGGWIFEGVPGILGDVVFSYGVTDGALTVQQTAYLNVVAAPPIVGDAGDDTLLGTPQDDEIDAGSGDDNIIARDGDDTIIAGPGDDHIVAGAGNDVIHAGCGNDIVYAGSGNDIVFGGCGDDRIFGEDGDDILYGEAGDDLLVGSSGSDDLFGGDGNDELQGGEDADALRGDAGNDKLAGDQGDDVLSGGAGNDIMAGGDGSDALTDGDGEDCIAGGAGDDHVVAAADTAADRFSGDSGTDTIDYSLAVCDLSIDLTDGTVESAEVGQDSIAGFEHVIAGAGHDYIIAGPTYTVLTGGGGKDVFDFRQVTDTIPDGHDGEDAHGLSIDSDSSGQGGHDEVVARITDFRIGDRLYVVDFEIKYRDAEELAVELQDAFDQIYLSGGNDNRSVKVKFDKIDDRDITIVEVRDTDNDGLEDTYSIEIEGRHDLSVTMTTV